MIHVLHKKDVKIKHLIIKAEIIQTTHLPAKSDEKINKHFRV